MRNQREERYLLGKLGKEGNYEVLHEYLKLVLEMERCEKSGIFLSTASFQLGSDDSALDW